MMIFNALLLFYSVGCVVGLNTIVSKGNKFFDSVTKDQFFIKGVAYQPRTSKGLYDPLADPEACARDAGLMSKLGLNLIRVYEVDPKKDHTQCMKSFADVGIYILLDIATPKNSIDRSRPDYTVQLYNGYKSAVNAFHDFDNMFGYIAGNEVTNDNTNTAASAFVKAALRDVKQYIKDNKKKILPVGYATNDDDNIREAIRDYFTCGEEIEQVDFYGVNIYEWCGESSYVASGYSKRTEEMRNYNKPAFLSEYGCNLASPRPFSEVAAIYSKPMTDVWSGGIAYEWTQETNNYGLVRVAGSSGSSSGNSTTGGKIKRAAAEVELLQDYKNLQKQLSKVSPKGVKMDSYNQTLQGPKCPGATKNWKANTKLPPTPSEGACQCMMDTASCVATDKVGQVHGNGTAAVGVQLDAMCGLTSCKDISGNGETGDYGPFSFCGPKEKLTWLFYSYSVDNMGACDHEGNAMRVTPKRHDIQECTNVKPDRSTPKEPGNDPAQTADTMPHPLPALGPLSALVLFVLFTMYST
ncbi:hypothetical protein DM01DRAFT_1410017 [Hesseltinella vesiculosa]|uniref:1,3-beta-glucanosyltransferase n=1 Tax=Hesseltinella vesiculosa TaxID=101127 RepID=A0A1X2G8R2_9FUNG|nr:hypothetical protein DM01DRAFT_1410017 [Hesseltinella vesiculosa]